MASHSALVIHALQQPPSFCSRPTPEPGDDEVLLKVSIVGLNPHDGSGKAYGLFIKDVLPSPFGIDIVGTVVKKGHNVTKFSVGDQVFALGSPFSPDSTGTQEYCLVPAWQSSLIPSNISPDEAATFPLNAMTMVFALFHDTGLNLHRPFGTEGDRSDYSSESILIVGGGAATGKFGIQLARLAHFRNILVVASKSNESELKRLGATVVIDRCLTEEEIERQIRLAVGDELIYAVDCVGWGSDGQTLGARALSNSRKGTLVALVLAGGVDESRIGPKALGYEHKKILCLTLKYPGITKSFWDALPRLIEGGKLVPTTFQVIDKLDPYGIDSFLDAYISREKLVKPHIHIGSHDWTINEK